MMVWLEAASAIFALLAAVFWFLSAAKKLPPMISYWDQTPETDPFFVAMRYANDMNRRAAFCAGISALLQVLTIFPGAAVFH